MPFPTVVSRLKKLVLIFLGLVFLGLGIIGFVMPGLPGTIWLIIAATLFVRSSDRLYNFVVQNRLFGPQVKEFLETGGVSLRAKVFSLVSIWVFSIASVVLAPYGWLFDVPVLLLAIAGTIYLISRPTVRTSA